MNPRYVCNELNRAGQIIGEDHRLSAIIFFLIAQGTINWRASYNPDFIQNYFLIKGMFDFFDNRDKCRKPGFLRGNIYTSCISMVLLDHFANKSNTFLSPSNTAIIQLDTMHLFAKIIKLLDCVNIQHPATVVQ